MDINFKDNLSNLILRDKLFFALFCPWENFDVVGIGSVASLG